MLNDPLVLLHNQTLTFAGGVASNFRRTAIGKYVCVDGAYTSGQPARLSLVNSVKLAGPSTYKLRYEYDKDIAPVNGVQQADDTMRIDIIVSGNLRSFLASDFAAGIETAALVLSRNFTRIIAGES